MLSKNVIVDVQKHLLDRTTKLLEQVSFNLEIMSIDVQGTQQQVPGGIRPVWGIVYQARGLLLGPANYIMQMTVVDTPFIPDETLSEALAAGCNMMRESRAKQGNGVTR
jgi:hypothetical protein